MFKVVVPGVSDPLIDILKLSAENAFKAYCKVNVIPRRANTLIVKMMKEQHNKSGTEHLKSHTYGNVSETFNDDYSSNIYSEMDQFKVKMWVK